MHCQYVDWGRCLKDVRRKTQDKRPILTQKVMPPKPEITPIRHNYRELRIWHKGIELVDACYDFAATLPVFEKYNIISQILRAAASVPSNIAEGSAKRTDAHFAEFLSSSLGSCFELDTYLVICERRRMGDVLLRDRVGMYNNELKNMISTFREKLEAGERPRSD